MFLLIQFIYQSSNQTDQWIVKQYLINLVNKLINRSNQNKVCFDAIILHSLHTTSAERLSLAESGIFLVHSTCYGFCTFLTLFLGNSVNLAKLLRTLLYEHWTKIF